MERGHLSDHDVPASTDGGGEAAGAAGLIEPLPGVAAPDPDPPTAPVPSPASARKAPVPPGRVAPPSPDHAGPSLPPAAPTSGAGETPAPATPWRGRLTETRARGRLWWSRAPDNLRGSVLMIAAFFVFAVMTASIKAIGTRIPLPQTLLLRQMIMTVLLIPLFASDIRTALSTKHLGLQVTRGVFSLMSMLVGFTAVLHVPLADVTALGFSQVLFVTVAAVFILKERVGWRRWAATLVGFVGVLIMLRPTGDGLSNPYGLLAVIGALFGCGITITVRLLAQTEKTATILLYQALIICAALAVPTVLWWVPPTPREWGLIVLIGFVGTAGQYLITRAYQVGEAAALAPLDFIRLLIATAIGYVIFAEVPTVSTFLGASIVVGATIYTVRRNASTGRPRPRTETEH
ncbi:DMT family transporter [Prosthecomicrobium sp. N25]|uniref:DMT family transporter n=1 Tax=Prosthecomicrobium sp. N25 TaxID=3129254 RepID=UPI003077FE7A